MKLFIVFSIITCFCQPLSFSNGRPVSNKVWASGPKQVKAVNLGGWLVTEGWIKPSLFDGINNKDMLDGTGLQFKSVTVGKYLCAESGGGTIIVANRTSASGWETFRLWRINETTFNFRVFDGRFVGLNTAGNGIDTIAEAESPGTTETFQIQRNPDDLNRVRIKAPNGFFLQVKTEEVVSADYEGNGGWGDDDPSVFLLTISGRLQGEYQLTNGYGPLLAPQVLKEHWSTFIVEDDFKFIKENGLNAVRIPVGWWIASDPSPPKPYVPGSLQALDNAFSWAEYAKSPSLFAVELINEPLSPGVSLANLTKYYQAGYDVVRKHSATAYVVLSNRLGPSEPTELFGLANGLRRSVIDVHYYNLFSSIFDNLTVQQNIDYVHNNRSAQVNQLTTSNGPLIFVGEWVAEWQVSNATKEDYQRYAAAQLEVFGRASFGWAYWTLKNVNNHWSMEWMIENGYIKL
ncbi:Glucan 1,3-beta-glucosidase [Sesamum angolense]|uniref:Glucan 1,3-beta-glucosidase n=1 Tax=Sesamum angolense TaxID=2727404 RepID=A0AAE1W6U2_9LAMI|nr:Glucan 1,3-beta-glucosidase [Sesamum angolense]